MIRIVLDAELRAKLKDGTAKGTFTDEAGKVIGHYLPDDLYQGILDALVPPGEGDRQAAREEFQRGEAVTSDELLAGIREACSRWEGEP
jgi:hypothetical protein